MRAANRPAQPNPVRRVFMVTLACNLMVALAKIGLGLATGLLAIVADGLHSLTDGLSNVVGIVACSLAQRPPDADHHYGHRRIEVLATLVIGLMLALLAWELAREAATSLRNTGPAPTAPMGTVLVLAATLPVQAAVAAYQTRAGRRLRSVLLLADATHTRADVGVTSAVLLSLTLTTVTGWAWLDGAMACIVAALIARAAWRILGQAVRVLADAAPYQAEMLAALVADVPGVADVARARSRGTPEAAHIDIDVRVDQQTTVAQTAVIEAAIHARLGAALTGIEEVEVHFLPRTFPGA